MSRVDEIQSLIRNSQRRLQKLKEQKASFGLYAPPYILTEIEDVEVEIQKLQIELENTNDLPQTRPLPHKPVDQITNGIPQNPNVGETQILRFPQMQNGDYYIERFSIKGHIGRGGFSDVYLAWDDTSNNGGDVALKLFRMEGQPAHIQRYIEREALMARRLSSGIPGLIETYDVKWLPQKYGLYIVQRYIPSRSLHEYIETKIHLDTQEAVKIAINLCEPLGYLHRQQIAHCDVKPLNVLIKDKPVLIDLGAARFFNETIQKEEIVISIPYSSKDLITGSPVDGRVDIYSLGMSLLHMLVGLPDWIKKDRRSIDFSTGIIPSNPLSIMPTETELENYIKNSLWRISSPRLGACIRKSLSYDPKQQFENIVSFKDELQYCLQELEVV